MPSISEMTVIERQAHKQELKERVDLRNAMERLIKNEDFKRVFMKGYCEDEAVRIVHLHGEEAFNQPDNKKQHREELQERMLGIARFSEYVRYTVIMGNQAQKELDEFNASEAELQKSGPTIQ